MNAATRYEGKPFLRFLDCYVLRAIGELGASQDATLRTMQPKLAQLYQTDGEWFEIVAKQMEFPTDLEGKILEIWQAGSRRAREAGLSVDPMEFTIQFVDTNFQS